VQIKVTGLKEVDAELKKLGSKEGTKVLRRAMLIATAPIVKQAQANAPKRSGALAESIGSRFGVGREEGLRSSILPPLGGRFTVVIAPLRKSRVAVALYNLVYGRRRPDIYHGHLVEFGTRHSRAQPFLKPALDAKAPQAVHSLASEIKAGIERLLARGKR
jgi:HK97 gp10 family phage protein